MMSWTPLVSLTLFGAVVLAAVVGGLWLIGDSHGGEPCTIDLEASHAR